VFKSHLFEEIGYQQENSPLTFLTLWVLAHAYMWEKLFTGFRATYIYIRSERKSSFYDPGSQNNVQFLWLKCFLETWLSSQSMDPLMGFLAYLEPKLWFTNQKLDINSNPTKGSNLSHFG